MDKDMKFEYPILDLSIKSAKHVNISKGSKEEQYLESPFNNNNQCSQSSCNMDVSTHLNTPPYESEGIKNYEFVYKYHNALGSDVNEGLNQSMYPMLPGGSAYTPAEAERLSNMLSQNTGDLNKMQQHELHEQNEQDQQQTLLSPTSVMSNEDGLNQMSPWDASKKGTRPFKVYPNVTMFFGNVAPESIFDHNSNEAYEIFRLKMLETVRRANKGTNVKMRRENNKGCSPTSTIDDKDEAYREKRKKNNEAAKRSRDARKQKEDEIAIRAAFLEGENSWLKKIVRVLKEENEKLREGSDYRR